MRQREEKIRNPFFVAPNYQMTELQGAVALAQLDRVHDIVASRNRLGAKLNALLAGVPAVRPQTVPQGLKQPISYIYFGSIWSFSAVPRANSPRRWRPRASPARLTRSPGAARFISTIFFRSGLLFPPRRIRSIEGTVEATALLLKLRSTAGSQ